LDPTRDDEAVGLAVAELAVVEVLLFDRGVDLAVALVDLLDADVRVLGPSAELVVLEARGHVDAALRTGGARAG